MSTRVGREIQRVHPMDLKGVSPEFSASGPGKRDWQTEDMALWTSEGLEEKTGSEGL